MTKLNYAKCNRPARSRYDTSDEFARIPRPRFRPAPATENQIRYLQQLQLRHGHVVIDRVDALKLSRREASEMIQEFLPKK